MKSNKLLYIGLNGYAGSGKDTVAKMLKIILNFNWQNINQAKQYFNSYYSSNKEQFATFNYVANEEKFSTCIAFADQLKNICASMFGIPVERFYYNKGNSWICINKDFKYTEVKPNDSCIITAEDYFTSKDSYTNSAINYYMSLRELLVYVGTYVCQRDINKNIFVNIVSNTIRNKTARNSDLKYIICTDVRFIHEFDFIHQNNGIMINITRDGVEQLDNIAEHGLDEEEDYDYTIENNGTYDDLFEQVWSIVHDNPEFQNKVIELISHDGSDNYLRLIESSEDGTNNKYLLCTEFGHLRVGHDSGQIIFIDPSGGPMITVGEYIEGSKPSENLYVSKIQITEQGKTFIYTTTPEV